MSFKVWMGLKSASICFAATGMLLLMFSHHFPGLADLLISLMGMASIYYSLYLAELSGRRK